MTLAVQVFGFLLLKGSRRERRENRLSIIVCVLVRIVFNNHYSLKSRNFIVLPLFTKIKKIFVSVYTQTVISKTYEKGFAQANEVFDCQRHDLKLLQSRTSVSLFIPDSVGICSTSVADHSKVSYLRYNRLSPKLKRALKIIFPDLLRGGLFYVEIFQLVKRQLDIFDFISWKLSLFLIQSVSLRLSESLINVFIHIIPGNFQAKFHSLREFRVFSGTTT